MSQLYDIYQSDTFHLARSVVIKLDLVAEAINKELVFRGYPIAPDSPASYKYYLNLSGEYHESDHDLIMQQYGSHHIMVDVATNTGYESVPFVSTLFHGDTANRSLLNEYQQGSNFYNRLVVKYPQFETLIRGILSPINIEEAIRAPNGAILSIAHQHRITRDNGEVYYQVPNALKGTKTSILIESQEHNLITQLQEWISKTLFRWVVDGYSLSDDLYVAFVVGVLSAMMPSKIMNLRWGNAHTSYAHTFHIREYLNSHGLLGKYVQFIPLAQILYLYRNVRYLELNLGKTFTFDEIIDNMLTPTKVPMAGYYFKHDIARLRTTSDALLPEGRMMREHINFKSLGAGTDRRDIREILERQVPLARENYRFLDNVEYETRETIKWSGDDELIVKVLESELTDIADPVPVTLLSQLIWFWAYLSSQDKYTGSIFVSNPVTGDRIALTPLNAFILMIYCANIAGRNQYLEYIPNDSVTAHWITKSNLVEEVPPEGGYHTMPSFDVMRNQTEQTYLSDKELIQVLGNYEGRYKSTDPSDFFEMVKEHHDSLASTFLDICKIENAIGHGYAEHVFFHKFWHDIPVRLTTEPVKYSEWLPRLGINFAHFTQVDYNQLSLDLIEECTGLDDDADINRVELQRSMIEVLKHFGSYTTHYLQSANQGAITNSHGKYVRVVNLEVEGDAALEDGIVISLDMFNDRVEALISQKVPMDSPDLVDAGISDATMNADADMRLTAEVGDVIFNTQMVMANIEVLTSQIVYDDMTTPRALMPPVTTVFYHYTDYLSKYYSQYTNPAVTVDTTDITGMVNDFPDIVDTLGILGLVTITGTTRTIVKKTIGNVSDSLSTTGLIEVNGSLVHIVKPKQTDTSERLSTGIVSTITGVHTQLNIKDHGDATQISVVDISGSSNDPQVIPLVDDVLVSVTDMTVVIQDAPVVHESIQNDTLSIVGVSYDEPKSLASIIGNVTTITLDVVDDRKQLLVDSVTHNLEDIVGRGTEMVDTDGGSTASQTSVVGITGDSKDDPTLATTPGRVSYEITELSGTSSELLLPVNYGSSAQATLTDLTGTVIDYAYRPIDSELSVTIGDVSMLVVEHHYRNLNDSVIVNATTVTGEIFDELELNNVNAATTVVQNVEMVVYDGLVKTYGSQANVTVVSLEATIRDDREAVDIESTTIDIETISGAVLRELKYTLADAQTISVVFITGSSRDVYEIGVHSDAMITTLAISGDVIDESVPLSQYGSATHVNVISINGNGVDEP